MDDAGIDRTLAACEGQLQAGETPDLRTLGFWRAVAAVKRHPERVDRYATRIAAIDRRAFRRRVRLAFPVSLGVIALDLGLFGGLLLLGVAIAVDHPWRELLVLVAAGALDVTTHGLAHLAVGTFVGIDFTDWFVDLPKRPQPGFKIDYASYLRASPRHRAWMHSQIARTRYCAFPSSLFIRLRQASTPAPSLALGSNGSLPFFGLVGGQ